MSRRSPARALRVVPKPKTITIDRARELLGDEADDMTDFDISQASREAQRIAREIVRVFRQRRVS